MLIESQAGEFEIDIKGFERHEENLIMVGAMGVWEARTHFTPRDVTRLLWTVLSSGAVWGFLLTLPFNLLTKRGAIADSNGNNRENT